MFFQIVELNLDNCRATNIEGLTEEFTNLESLSLINVGLTTLKGFPKLPNLRKVSNFVKDFALQPHYMDYFVAFFPIHCSWWI